jgi:hypothetical protein
LAVLNREEKTRAQGQSRSLISGGLFPMVVWHGAQELDHQIERWNYEENSGTFAMCFISDERLC